MQPNCFVKFLILPLVVIGGFSSSEIESFCKVPNEETKISDESYSIQDLFIITTPYVRRLGLIVQVRITRLQKFWNWFGWKVFYLTKIYEVFIHDQAVTEFLKFLSFQTALALFYWWNLWTCPNINNMPIYAMHIMHECCHI